MGGERHPPSHRRRCPERRVPTTEFRLNLCTIPAYFPHKPLFFHIDSACSLISVDCLIPPPVGGGGAEFVKARTLPPSQRGVGGEAPAPGLRRPARPQSRPRPRSRTPGGGGEGCEGCGVRGLAAILLPNKVLPRPLCPEISSWQGSGRTVSAPHPSLPSLPCVGVPVAWGRWCTTGASSSAPTSWSTAPPTPTPPVCIPPQTPRIAPDRNPAPPAARSFSGDHNPAAQRQGDPPGPACDGHGYPPQPPGAALPRQRTGR